MRKLYIPKPTRHWTPRYVRDRIAFQVWQKRNPEAPWLVSSAVEFLDGWLKATDEVVEFGAGRSTVWFSQRVKSVFSVEHNKEWFESVQSQIAEKNISNIRLIYNSDTDGQYISSVEQDYSGIADVVLVDSVYRDHCALWALKHLRSGGLLVLDNVARYLPSPYIGPGSIGPNGKYPTELWKEFAKDIEGKRRVFFSNGVTHTLIVFI